MRSVNRILATTTSVWSDDVWVVDCTLQGLPIAFALTRGQSRRTRDPP